MIFPATPPAARPGLLWGPGAGQAGPSIALVSRGNPADSTIATENCAATRIDRSRHCDCPLRRRSYITARAARLVRAISLQRPRTNDVILDVRSQHPGFHQ